MARIWSRTHGALRKNKGVGVTLDVWLHKRSWLHISPGLHTLVIIFCVCHKIITLLITWKVQPWRRYCGYKSKVPLVAGLYSLVILLWLSYWSRIKLYPEKGIAVVNRKPHAFLTQSAFWLVKKRLWEVSQQRRKVEETEILLQLLTVL